MASPRRRPPPEPPHRADPPPPVHDSFVNSAPPPKTKSVTPPRVSSVTSSPKRTLSKEVDASPRAEAVSPPKKIASPAAASARVVTSPVNVVSPPAPKPNRADSKSDGAASAVAPRGARRDLPGRDAPFRAEKLSLVAAEADGPHESADLPPLEAAVAREEPARGEESNGVGDKIKIFEKAAEDAATAGRLSRPGSMRRARAERLPSDEPPPPPVAEVEPRRPRSDGDAPEGERPRSEPQRIVRPEFRPLASPAEVTIRSPSLGAKAPERFPSHGTAFRNVSAAPPTDAARALDDDAADAFKTCKFRGRERPAASRGSSYFTRGSEEIWLVKKKDIEEIEERVLDSFRRAGARGGRGARRGYARSESLEPARAAGGAHVLKRQSSVACTCGHDKKPRARARSHPEPADDVLDKYETLV